MAALGIILFVLGAILAFAVDAALENVDLALIGYILMGAGGVAFLVGLVQRTGGGSNRIRTTREVSDDGRTTVEDKRID